ncbi:hypothetical protein [Synechococcus sp. PCC 7335]|uniref:hypothetical protein n=1 Tax=Synechococcus sp. (strain ATCC 29403 / PCC 7335) TaxID=91464 RepID=UPI0012F94901|nr:hypothetical protein [Synechococcus sp. PCC 7335]
MTLQEAYVQLAKEFDFTPQQVEYRLTRIQQGTALKIKREMARRLMTLMKSSEDGKRPSP